MNLLPFFVPRDWGTLADLAHADGLLPSHRDKKATKPPPEVPVEEPKREQLSLF